MTKSKIDPQQEQIRLLKLSENERELSKQGYTLIAGLDEVGRGPVAGPVTVACVILPENCLIPGIDDSKKLSAAKRQRLEREIKEQAIAYAIASVNHRVIDRYNILGATKIAMIKAIKKMPVTPQYLLVDAIKLDIDIPQRSIIHGDALSISIAAASILAKNERDRIMERFARIYPQYDFAANKGYPTKAHGEAIVTHGRSPIHRSGFKFPK